MLGILTGHGRLQEMKTDRGKSGRLETCTGVDISSNLIIKSDQQINTIN